jgi:hypothetical protein
MKGLIKILLGELQWFLSLYSNSILYIFLIIIIIITVIILFFYLFKTVSILIEKDYIEFKTFNIKIILIAMFVSFVSSSLFLLFDSLFPEPYYIKTNKFSSETIKVFPVVTKEFPIMLSISHRKDKKYYYCKDLNDQSLLCKDTDGLNYYIISYGYDGFSIGRVDEEGKVVLGDELYDNCKHRIQSKENAYITFKCNSCLTDSQLPYYPYKL